MSKNTLSKANLKEGLANLQAKAINAASALDENFLEAGRALSELQKADTAKFTEAVEKSGIGRRKAYYLITIVEAFAPYHFPERLLIEIGWTKLLVIAPRIEPSMSKKKVSDMLGLAAENSARHLETLLRGQQPKTNEHCVMLYFSPKDYKDFKEAAVSAGAEAVGRGLKGKEKAVMKLIREAAKKPV